MTLAEKATSKQMFASVCFSPFSQLTGLESARRLMNVPAMPSIYGEDSVLCVLQRGILKGIGAFQNHVVRDEFGAERQ